MANKAADKTYKILSSTFVEEEDGDYLRLFMRDGEGRECQMNLFPGLHQAFWTTGRNLFIETAAGLAEFIWHDAATAARVVVWLRHEGEGDPSTGPKPKIKQFAFDELSQLHVLLEDVTLWKRKLEKDFNGKFRAEWKVVETP